MPCEAQEHSRGCTASRPHLTTAAAIKAAIVGAAGRGGQPHRCAPRCDKLLEARMWTETPISVPKIVVFGRLPAAPARFLFRQPMSVGLNVDHRNRSAELKL